MITIRPLQRSDVMALLPIYGDQEVCLQAGFYALTQTQINEILPELLDTTYAILDNQELVGVYTFDPIDQESCTCGFILRKSAWHHHIITNSFHLFIHELTSKGYHTIYADCLKTNKASQFILQKAGFQLEGEIVRPMLISDAWQPCFLFKYTNK